MEGDLGELGFWLGLGIFLAGGAIAGALKERGKESEKQATLRALLEREDGDTAEIVAYLREKDAAELKLQRQALGLDWADASAAGVVAVIVAGLGIVAGLISLAHTSPRQEFVNGVFTRVAQPGFDFPLAPVIVLLAIWAAGFIIAAVIWRVFGKKKNDAQPGA